MNRFLIYKLSGGLNHMLKQINNAIHLSESTNRRLIIDTKGGAFDNDFNDFFYIPNFEYFTNFEILKELNVQEKYETYITKRVNYINGTYYLNDRMITLLPEDIFKSEEVVIFFTYLKKGLGKKNWRIKVKEDIVNKIKSLPEIKEDYIGFHFRNTDMKNDITELCQKILNYTNETKILYLATDDSTALEKIKKILPSDIKIIQYTKPYAAGGKNIHYGNPNKEEVIFNSLVDIYFLKYSKYFISSPGSSFSERVNIIRNKDDFFL